MSSGVGLSGLTQYMCTGLDGEVSIPGGELPSIRETRLSSAHSDTL